MDKDSDMTSGNHGQGFIDGEAKPLLKPGTYDLSFRYYETVKLFGGKVPKLVLWFQIITQGKAYGIVLPRYYNVTRIKDKPKRWGDFVVGRNSLFLREYVNLFCMPASSRLDRIPMTAFKNVIIRGRIKTVHKGYDARRIPKGLEYSVIAELEKKKKL